MKRLLDAIKPFVPSRLRPLFFEKGLVDPAGRPAAEVFRDIYRLNAWGSAESRSGVGSTLAFTKRLRAELPGFLAKHGVRSMIDVPCGDFNWMRHVPLGSVRYLGLDVVPELIERNTGRFGSETVSFRTLDLLREVPPRADLILCRDVLIHFSHADVAKALANLLASGSEWLLTTTYREGRNRHEPTGGFFRIHLEAEPFAFPSADDWLADGEGRHAPCGRMLGLWKLSRLRDRIEALGAEFPSNE